MKKLLKHWKSWEPKKIGELLSYTLTPQYWPQGFHLYLNMTSSSGKPGGQSVKGDMPSCWNVRAFYKKGAAETPQRVRCALNNSCFCSFAWINKIRSTPVISFWDPHRVIPDLSLWRMVSLVVACWLSCSAACGNLSSLTRDQTHIPCVAKMDS